MGRHELPQAQQRSLGTAILTVLALSDDSGEAGLEVAYAILETNLQLGLTDDEYQDLVDQLALLWEHRGSRATAGWLADVYEQLDLHAGPTATALSFVSATLQTIAPLASRLNTTILDGLRSSAAALGGADLVEETLQVAHRPSANRTATWCHRWRARPSRSTP